MSDQLDRVLAATGEATVPLSDLLDAVESYLSRFIVYPSDYARIAHVLWIFHTHCMDQWDSTPRIAFLSPEPSSGKTRALELTQTLVPRPIESVNVTPAYLFRKVSDPDGRPTILYDEIDTVLGPRAKENEEIRGMLNAGHRRGAMAGRCVVRGQNITTEELPAYCAVAVAGLHDLPETLMSRSIVISMRKRAPTENISQYRPRIHSGKGNALRECIEKWAAEYRLDGNYPDMPTGVEDRAADVWEPLLAIADAADDQWTYRARVAAVALVAQGKDRDQSLGVRLLMDLHTIFDSDDKLPTKTILQRLNDLEEAPWGDLRGKALDSRRLAYYLRRYDVHSRTIRISKKDTPKGYAREDLSDPWDRYLPPPLLDKSTTSATSATNSVETGKDSDSFNSEVAPVAQVAANPGTPERCPKCDGEGCNWCERAAQPK